MYLSKLTLDPRHPQARRDLGDAYEMHRTLVRAFAPDPETAPPRFLWRLEAGMAMNSPANVLVQADVPADWSPIAALSGYTTEILENKQVDLAGLVKAGGRYRFRLKANPTVTRAGKRYGLTSEDEQMAWVARQGLRHGFSVLACVRGSSERIQVRQGNSGHRITVHSVLLDGMVEVQGAALFEQALRNGLGHAKALGMGLLSIAKVSEAG